MLGLAGFHPRKTRDVDRTFSTPKSDFCADYLWVPVKGETGERTFSFSVFFFHFS